MAGPGEWVTLGVDNGGTKNSGTVMDSRGQFLVKTMLEMPSLVLQGPEKAIPALAETVDRVLTMTGTPRSAVRAVGLDTPGPASAAGVLSSRGATNFGHPAWGGFDIRGAFEQAIGMPVVYNNDANAAALYAHHVRYLNQSAHHGSVSAIVGTGLGAGVVVEGRVVSGVAGMAGELGHVKIPLDGLLEDGQPVPQCNCGLSGDAESVASLTGIARNLLPYWLTRYPGHELAGQPAAAAAKAVRGYAEKGDEMSLHIFRQQAIALGRVFSLAAKFTDPDVYFVGGGVVEAAPHFRDWFLAAVREHTSLMAEQEAVAEITLVPDLDMAGARGSAIAAATWVTGKPF